jgi:quercetin dioxygenase-like cupin family protein
MNDGRVRAGAAASVVLFILAAPANDAGAQAQNSQTITRAASQASIKGPAEYFTGSVRVESLFDAKESAPYSGGVVTFEPGARSNWHTHPTGQHLIVTAGVGLTQEWNGAATQLRAGDVVWCPPGVRHWHGAAPSSAMTHIAISGTLEGKNVEWMDRVTDEQYARGAASQ